MNDILIVVIVKIKQLKNAQSHDIKKWLTKYFSRKTIVTIANKFFEIDDQTIITSLYHANDFQIYVAHHEINVLHERVHVCREINK